MPRPDIVINRFRVHFLLTRNFGTLAEVSTKECEDITCALPEHARQRVRNMYPDARIVFGKIKVLRGR